MTRRILGAALTAALLFGCGSGFESGRFGGAGGAEADASDGGAGMGAGGAAGTTTTSTTGLGGAGGTRGVDGGAGSPTGTSGAGGATDAGGRDAGKAESGPAVCSGSGPLPAPSNSCVHLADCPARADCAMPPYHYGCPMGGAPPVQGCILVPGAVGDPRETMCCIELRCVRFSGGDDNCKNLVLVMPLPTSYACMPLASINAAPDTTGLPSGCKPGGASPGDGLYCCP